MKPYQPVDIEVATKGDPRIPVQTYISKPRAGQKPSAEYLQRVIRAAESLGFPQPYLAKLRRTETAKTSAISTGRVGYSKCENMKQRACPFEVKTIHGTVLLELEDPSDPLQTMFDWLSWFR